MTVTADGGGILRSGLGAIDAPVIVAANRSGAVGTGTASLAD